MVGPTVMYSQLTPPTVTQPPPPIVFFNGAGTVEGAIAAVENEIVNGNGTGNGTGLVLRVPAKTGLDKYIPLIIIIAVLYFLFK